MIGIGILADYTAGHRWGRSSANDPAPVRLSRQIGDLPDQPNLLLGGIMPGVILGRPAQPYSDEIISSVSRAVGSVDGVAEAHFPQMFTVGQMEKPEQTLIVVLGKDRDEREVMQGVVTLVRRELPDGPDVLMVPMTGRDGLLSTVRGTGCQVFKSSTEKPAPKQWWRFW